MSWRDLVEEGNQLFSKKDQVNTLWQEIAENFYPERATFLHEHTLGEEFATHLYTSYPLMARRDLGDSFSMSRPKGEEWHFMSLEDEDREDDEAREWMERANNKLRRINYDRSSNFTRAMKQGDHDWCTFGQCALSVELNRDRNGLFYRNWHLKDMAWTEGFDGVVDHFWRKWNPTNNQLRRFFGDDKLSPECCDDKARFKTTRCMHIFVPGYRAGKEVPFYSYYVDLDHEHVIEEVPYAYGYYVVPRWATVSDSQYAYSPAIICGLPDARLLQDMTRVLLEAGQKAVDPPMIAVQDELKSDIDIQPGGVTAVSAEYDERLGDVLRPLSVDKSGLGFGIELTDRVQMMLAKALYLDKMEPLPRKGEMTATEASIEFQKHIRAILPVFEPKEDEMEARVIELGFEIGFRHGAFGRDLPESMQGASYQWKFISPLSKAIEEKEADTYMKVLGILQGATTLDPMTISNFNSNEATRDAIKGVGAPQEWLNDEDEVKAAQQQMQMQRQAQQELETLQQAKDVVSA